jgi:hypothetical protein
MIVIVDYGVGNLKSIRNILGRAGIECVISSEPDELRAASKLILPGVGHFRFGMKSLHERGLVEVLNERVRRAGRFSEYASARNFSAGEARRATPPASAGCPMEICFSGQSMGF